MWLKSYSGSLVNLDHTFNIVKSLESYTKVSGDTSATTTYYKIMAYGASGGDNKLTLFKSSSEIDRDTVLANIKGAIYSGTTNVIEPYYNINNTNAQTSDTSTPDDVIVSDLINCTGVTIDTSFLELRIGESKTIKVNTLPSNTTDKLSTSIVSPEVASLSLSGTTYTVHALKEGNASITFTCGNNFAMLNITVIPAVTISVDHTNVVFTDSNLRDYLDITIEPNTTSASTVIVTDDPDIADIEFEGNNEDGYTAMLTAKEIGTTSIYVECGGSSKEISITNYVDNTSQDTDDDMPDTGTTIN